MELKRPCLREPWEEMGINNFVSDIAPWIKKEIFISYNIFTVIFI